MSGGLVQKSWPDLIGPDRYTRPASVVIHRPGVANASPAQETQPGVSRALSWRQGKSLPPRGVGAFASPGKVLAWIFFAV